MNEFECLKERLPLSVVLIASNEGQHLKRCLQVFSQIAQEIIAVINDCQDNTREVLLEMGAQVIESPWEGMMAQKNKALSYATQPWVFNIDADEVPSIELLREVMQIVKSDNRDIAGVSMPRMSFYLGRWIRHGDWYPDRVLRLFRREKGIFIGGKDHEKVQVEGKILKIKADLYHYSFPTLNAQILKMPRFGDLFLERLLEKKQPFRPGVAIFRAFWRFFRAYVLKLGFLDGVPGFYLAYFQSFSTFYRYMRLYEYMQQHKLYSKLS